MYQPKQVKLFLFIDLLLTYINCVNPRPRYIGLICLAKGSRSLYSASGKIRKVLAQHISPQLKGGTAHCLQLRQGTSHPPPPARPLTAYGEGISRRDETIMISPPHTYRVQPIHSESSSLTLTHLGRDGAQGYVKIFHKKVKLRNRTLDISFANLLQTICELNFTII